MATPMDSDSSWTLTPEQAAWAHHLFPELALVQLGSMFEFAAPNSVADEIFAKIRASMQGLGLEAQLQEVPAHQPPVQSTWQTPQRPAYDPRPQPQPQSWQPQPAPQAWQQPQQTPPPPIQWQPPTPSDDYYARERAQGVQNPDSRRHKMNLLLAGGALVLGGGLVGAVARGLVKLGEQGMPPGIRPQSPVNAVSTGPQIYEISVRNNAVSGESGILNVLTRRTGSTAGFSIQVQIDGGRLSNMREYVQDQNQNPKRYILEKPTGLSEGIHHVKIIASDTAGRTTAAGNIIYGTNGSTGAYCATAVQIDPDAGPIALFRPDSAGSLSALLTPPSKAIMNLKGQWGILYFVLRDHIDGQNRAPHTIVWRGKFNGTDLTTPPVNFILGDL